MYFETPGKINTEKTVQLAFQAAKENNINTIVVASNQGETASYLKNSGFNVVVVTHVNGFLQPGNQ